MNKLVDRSSPKSSEERPSSANRVVRTNILNAQPTALRIMMQKSKNSSNKQKKELTRLTEDIMEDLDNAYFPSQTENHVKINAFLQRQQKYDMEKKKRIEKETTLK